MNHNPESAFAEDIDEELTAYLDGELSGAKAQHLEGRLVHDESLRLRLAELRRAYDFLDELPETPHNQRFTQSTIEHVVQHVEKSGPSLASSATDAPSRLSPLRRFSLLIGLGTALLCGVVGGLFLRGLSIRNEIRELSLLTNLTGLKDVSYPEVAERLSKEKVALEYLKKRYSDKFIPNVPNSQEDLGKWISSLTPLQKTKLNNERDLVRTMNPESRETYAALDKEIRSMPNASSAQEAVRLVGLVMDSLMNPDRLAIAEVEPEGRIAYLKGKMYFKAADYYFSQIPSESDRAKIEAWSRETLIPEFMALTRDFREFDPDRSNIAGLLNRFSYQMHTIEDERLQGIVDPLIPNLSSDGATLLAGLPPLEQLQILFNHLAPNRTGNVSTFLDFYERTPAEYREGWDLGDPREIRMLLNRDRRRSTSGR